MKPLYTIIAGPNGCGKSSLCQFLARNEEELGLGINPDHIERYGIFHIEGHKRLKELKSGRVVFGLSDLYRHHKVSFCHETTLATDSAVGVIPELREKSYSIHMQFVIVESVELALSRIRERVAQGGHGIDEAKVRRVYKKAKAHFRDVMKMCDKVVLWDNTTKLTRVCEFTDGQLDISSLRAIPPQYLGFAFSESEGFIVS